MALTRLVYELTSRRLPHGSTYQRDGAAWLFRNGVLVQHDANVPPWGAYGLVVEDESTNLVYPSAPMPSNSFNGNDFPDNADRFTVTNVTGLAPGSGLFGYLHENKGVVNAAVRKMTDTTPLASTAVGVSTVWGIFENDTARELDIGFLDETGAWVGQANWDVTTMLASAPVGSGHVRGELHDANGPNSKPLIVLGTSIAARSAARKVGAAWTGAYQNRLRAIAHHWQHEERPGPTSPIITRGGSATRQRATLTAPVESVGGTATVVRLKLVAAPWLGIRQVAWQMDSGSDLDAGRVAVERAEDGHLLCICAGAILDLGFMASSSSVTLALAIGSGSMRASIDGAAVQTTAATLPAAIVERWGHGVLAGRAWHGQIDITRWLGTLDDAGLRALAVDSFGLVGDTVNTTPLAAGTLDYLTDHDSSAEMLVDLDNLETLVEW